MVKLKTNHESQPGSFMMRMMILGMGIFALMVYLSRSGSLGDQWMEKAAGTPDNTVEMGEFPLDDSTDQIVEHDFYTLGYNNHSEQASWVAYTLTKESLAKKNVPRTDWFEEDDAVLDKSAHHRDYSSSGYTRGHLAPAGDMAFSKEAMEQSFLMSNMSPQLRAFNGGVWRELEECVRDWAWKKEQLHIVTGPVLKGLKGEFIGKGTKIEVPERYYKVLTDGQHAIGFLLPNQLSTRPLQDFMVSVDDVEKATGIDFYKGVLSERREEALESTFDPALWKVSQGRFKKRLNEWNQR